MDGWLIRYKTSDRKAITLINYYLFGRISTIPTRNGLENYYYPGLLETTPYTKISNGCYFTNEIIDDFNGRLELIKASIELKEPFITAREYWNKFVETKGLKIKNW